MPASRFAFITICGLLNLVGCAALTPQHAAKLAATPAAATPTMHLAPCGTALPSDVLTQHGDCQRSGATLNELDLTPARVQSGAFGRLFDWEVDAQIYTQPLYVSQIMNQQGRLINMVIVATMNNTVYAFEAPARGSIARPSPLPIWKVGSEVFGMPVPDNHLFMPSAVFGLNIEPTIGITATPVIDRAPTRQNVYVSVKSLVPGAEEPSHDLYALDLLTGNVKAHTKINPTVTSPTGFTWTFDANHHLQRASLLLANDRIYAAFGSHQDTTPYHGWVVAYDADHLQPAGVYCTTCGHEQHEDCEESCMGGIWQAGGGPAVDGEGNLYVMTGNGTFEKDRNWGTSFVKLNRDLAVIGSWTPPTYDCLNRTDADLGSAGPLYLSDLSILVGGGKEGVLYALTPDVFQGSQVGAFDVGSHGIPPCDKWPRAKDRGTGYWSIQASPLWRESEIMDVFRYFNDGVAAQGFHHIHGAPVVWQVKGPSGERRLLYDSAERDVLRAFEFNQGFIKGSIPGDPPIDTFESVCKNSDYGMPGGFLTLSAHGDEADSGIVWASMPRYNKDALAHLAPGILRAYRAYPDATGKLVELWNSDYGVVRSTVCNPGGKKGPDQVGTFAKFVSPTVADGKVYMSTFIKELAVYGLKPTAVHAMIAPIGNAYDAELQIGGQLPESVDAGSQVSISITVRNRGTSTWRAADAIRLSSQTASDTEYLPIEGRDALTILHDVAPQGTYVFDFHLAMPAKEGVHYLTWRLLRTSENGQAAHDWIGASTNEWMFMILRPECAAVHARAKNALAQLRATPVAVGEVRAAGVKADLASIKADAEKQHCSLDADIIDAGAMHH
jgi:hypothetical protein